MLRTWLLILISPLAFMPARARAGELFVAAAADLNFAMKEMAVLYERQTGDRLRLSFGSSGNFYSQIVNGAPFDMYFSADVSYPRKLAAAGLGEPGGLFVYAVGQIVLWVPGKSEVDLESSGMQALCDHSVRKISIANPVHAPYGRAAVAAMQHYGIYGKVKGRLVFGESVLQAAQFVQSGAADIGIIPLSLAIAPLMRQSGRFWKIPAGTYPAIEQGALILRRAGKSGNLPAAQAFRSWIRGGQGRAILARFGFALPEEGGR
jgi:molybdate transport system substrate-binding protein